MKLRLGFVSNSSSSSFIIRRGDIATIALSMLKTVINEFSEDDKSNEVSNKKQYQRWMKNLKTALKKKDVASGKIGITMPSCNYETYIFKHDKDVYVSTCHNHMWDLDGIGGEGADNPEDEVHKKIGDRHYFNVKNGLIHSHSKFVFGENSVYCSFCEEGVMEYVEHKGKRLCATCYKGRLGLSPEEREERKIERLINKNKLSVSPIKFLEP